MSDHKVKIKSKVALPTTQREHDTFIMEEFYAAELPIPLLRKANRCRLYLQAMTVADIATGNGARIRRDAWTGVSDLHLNKRRYHWPTQHKPGPPDWVAWRKALSATLVTPGRLVGDVDPPLLRRLGKWTNASPDWRWYYSPTQDTVWERQGLGWNQWRSATRASARSSRRRWTLQQVGQPSRPRDCRLTVTCQRGNDAAVWTTGSAATLPPAVRPTPSGLIQRLQRGPQSRVWATTKCITDDDGSGFARALANGTAIAVSDGSYKDLFGTAASILQDLTGEGRIIVVNVAPGSPDSQGAYRSELSGLYGSLCVVEQVCEEHNVSSGRVTIGCDGEEALWRSCASKDIVRPTDSDFDLIYAIRTKIANLPVEVETHWVKGHQDDLGLGVQRLDLWARLNIWCDALAKQHWSIAAEQETEIQWEIEGEMPALWLGRMKVSSKVKDKLYDWCEGTPLREYWMTKRRIPSECAPYIDWSVAEQAAKGLGGFAMTLWKAKHLSGRQPWGRNMKRWGLWPESVCPICKLVEEDAAHIFQCARVGPIWTKAVEPIRAWMHRTNTDQDVADVIVDGITSFHRGDLPSIDRARLTADVQEASTEQDTIGWQNFVDGFASSKWRLLMEARFVARSRRSSGRRWTLGLFRQLWRLSRDLWDLRNHLAHDGLDSLVSRELDSIDAEIVEQFRRGRDGLRARIAQHYFRGGINRLLSRPTPSKKAWIYGITTARERQVRRRHGDSAVALESSRRLMMKWVVRRPPRLSCRLAPVRRRHGSNANGPDQREPD